MTAAQEMESHMNRQRMGSLDIEEGPKESESSPSKFSIMIKQVLCVLLYFFFGPTLIMTNKYILRDIGFSYPISQSCITAGFCSVAVWLYVTSFKVTLKHAAIVDRKFYLRNIMPIGFLQGSTVVMGMSAYLFLTVSFIQMLKAATPVMIVIFLRAFGIDYPSQQVVGSVFVICMGTLLSGSGEVKFNIMGVLCQVLAQVAEALKLVLTQKLLKNMKFDVVESLCYILPAATFWMFVAAALFELPKMNATTLAIVRENFYVWILAGFLAVGVYVINTVVIKFTGSLMMKLLGTARAASLVMFNVMFIGEEVSAVQFSGYTVSLIGFMAYSYFRTK
eukprot:CAMPEP_0167759854 /NCGR_PEP_ID=MMETSP0110_2-20121227/11254_1 /TAXON_ID=629695 /ORGANISM="Gymnochlora sp., Strain CCMP2014" /LENGTH=334 /DNA_ID=CAMNT_0007646285 /DNA_START=52 /DNA_END=1059 /DNA_ORIENTATION=+